MRTYYCIIRSTGGVERKTARCGTAGGERYVRVRPTLGAPRYLWFGSDKVIVRQLTEHETGTMNSIARRKSFRSQIKLNLKMADASASSGDHGCDDENGGGGADSGGAGEVGDEPRRGSGDGVDVGSNTTTAMTAVSVRNGFKYIIIYYNLYIVRHNIILYISIARAIIFFNCNHPYFKIYNFIFLKNLRYYTIQTILLEYIIIYNLILCNPVFFYY